jgi:hypothetical protein
LDIYGKTFTFAECSLKDCPFRYWGQYEDSETGKWGKTDDNPTGRYSKPYLNGGKMIAINTLIKKQ